MGYDEEMHLEYLEYNERTTKTRTGADLRNVRHQKPRMYASPESDRCPVQAYKVFSDHRPAGFSGKTC